MTTQEIERLQLLAAIAHYLLRNFDVEPDVTLAGMLAELDAIEGAHHA